MSITGAVVSAAIIAAMNLAMALIQAQAEVAAGTRDYTPEEIAAVDALNNQSEAGWDALVAEAKARLAGEPPAQPLQP